jgi:DNA replication protein DnaC
MSNIATLPLLLKELSLTGMYNHWEHQATVAQESCWSYPQYLASLSSQEVALRTERRIARHVKEAKLPLGKTLSSFDFKAAKSVNAAQIAALADDTAWVRNAHNLIIFGPSGVGKSHLASAITHRLIEHGVRALFTTTTTLLQKLQQARASYRLPEAVSKLSNIPLLVLDDIGYAKKDDAETSVLFELIADRYESTSLIITANQPFGEWDQIFPSSSMAVAAIDRLVHHATIINIQDNSYRMPQA